jgi:hypothetical protein
MGLFGRPNVPIPCLYSTERHPIGVALRLASRLVNPTSVMISLADRAFNYPIGGYTAVIRTLSSGDGL